MAVSHHSLLVLLIPPVNRLQDLLLHPRRVDVLGHWTDDLGEQYSTLIA